MIDESVRQECAAFVGRTRRTEDSLAPEPAEKLVTLLGGRRVEDFLPPTWHWLYFNRQVAPSQLDEDLHERTGLFLPPVPFPRRMWAAGDVTIHSPLKVDVPASKRSTVSSVDFKSGKTGPMCFVLVTHEIEQDAQLCIEEKQTIVYRERASAEPPVVPTVIDVEADQWVHPDSQLFFYSALTHNGHRIHWDRAYCRDVEGYPDLVVHGPLMATKLCEAMRGDDLGPCRFRFRAQAPVFATTPVRIVREPGEGVTIGRIERADGVTSMTAELS